MTNNNPAMNQSQLALFETPIIRTMPANYYRAMDEDVLREAFQLYRKHAHHYTNGSILYELAERYGLSGYWTVTVRCLASRGLLDEMNCYYGSNTPTDKSREYLGYSVHYRLKKGAAWC